MDTLQTYGDLWNVKRKKEERDEAFRKRILATIEAHHVQCKKDFYKKLDERMKNGEALDMNMLFGEEGLLSNTEEKNDESKRTTKE